MLSLHHFGGFLVRCVGSYVALRGVPVPLRRACASWVLCPTLRRRECSLVVVLSGAGTVRVVLPGRAVARNFPRLQWRPNNSFKPKPHLSFAYFFPLLLSCRLTTATLRLGLIQALGLTRMEVDSHGSFQVLDAALRYCVRDCMCSTGGPRVATTQPQSVVPQCGCLGWCCGFGGSFNRHLLGLQARLRYST